MSFSTGQKRNGPSTMLLSAPCIAKERQMSGWMETTSTATKIRKKRNNPERAEQQALVKWLNLANIAFCSIPNEGRRGRINGALMKSMGLTAGASDLFIAEPRGKQGGFWVEMKAPGKIPTVLQYEWLFKMRKKGYRAEWYDSWEKAKDDIQQYLTQPKFIVD